jgi:hypothetical protein
MYIHMYRYIYIYIYIYIHTYICMYIYTYIGEVQPPGKRGGSSEPVRSRGQKEGTISNQSTQNKVYLCIYKWVYIYVYIFIHMYIYVYVYMYGGDGP